MRLPRKDESIESAERFGISPSFDLAVHPLCEADAVLRPFVFEVILRIGIEVNIGEYVAGPARHVENIFEMDDTALVAVRLAANLEVD